MGDTSCGTMAWVVLGSGGRQDSASMGVNVLTTTGALVLTARLCTVVPVFRLA